LPLAIAFSIFLKSYFNNIKTKENKVKQRPMKKYGLSYWLTYLILMIHCPLLSACSQSVMSNPEHQCANPGNPVFSCMESRSHSSAEDPAIARSQNLMFKTTSSDYGARSATFESSPSSYHPISQTFSQHLGLCGMYQDNSFNTSLDHSHVYIPNYKTQGN